VIGEATPLSSLAAAAADRWLAAAGPWRRWGLVLPLLGIGTSELTQRSGPEPTEAQRAWLLAHLPTMLQKPCLVLLDLPPLLGAPVAAELYRQNAAHPVLLLGRWPVAPAILPAQPLVDTLIACAPRQRRTRLQSAIVVLDGERGHPLPGRSPRDPRTDNRYELDLTDLPDPASLRALGIVRVHTVLAPRPSPGPNARAALPRYASVGLDVTEVVAPH
jgi:hypothetical protein